MGSGHPLGQELQPEGAGDQGLGADGEVRHPVTGAGGRHQEGGRGQDRPGPGSQGGGQGRHLPGL